MPAAALHLDWWKHAHVNGCKPYVSVPAGGVQRAGLSMWTHGLWTSLCASLQTLESGQDPHYSGPHGEPASLPSLSSYLPWEHFLQSTGTDSVVVICISNKEELVDSVLVPTPVTRPSTILLSLQSLNLKGVFRQRAGLDPAAPQAACCLAKGSFLPFQCIPKRHPDVGHFRRWCETPGLIVAWTECSGQGGIWMPTWRGPCGKWWAHKTNGGSPKKHHPLPYVGQLCGMFYVCIIKLRLPDIKTDLSLNGWDRNTEEMIRCSLSISASRTICNTA